MDNERAQNTPTTDRFSSLPRDVQSLIFDLAYGEGAFNTPSNPKRIASLARLICKALLPVQREALYKAVLLRSYRQLDLFVRTVNSNTAVAKEVKGLTIDINWRSHGTIEDPVKVEAADPSFPSTAALRQLVQTVFNLEWLDVTGSSRISAAALNPADADTRFQFLESLSLGSSFTSFTDPFNVPHFVPLEHWPKLSSFSYIVERHPDSVRIETTADLVPVIADPAPVLPQIESLELVGPSGSTSWKPACFKPFSALTSLSLEDSSDETGSYGKLVFQALPNPQLLQSLSYKRSHPKHQIDMATITPFLRDVVTLAVGGEGVVIKKSFYTALNKFPLRTLTFDIGLKGVQTTELTKVVSGDKKHPTLEKLYLHHIRDCADEGFFPEWTKRFTRKGLEKFLKLAEREGIEVDGDAVDALNHVEEGVSIDELLEDMAMYKERYRNFAIGAEAFANDWLG